MTDLARLSTEPRYMCSPKANQGEPPRKVFVIQLREAREEWKRRRGLKK